MPEDDNIPIIDVSHGYIKENRHPLSRSPHPYRRRRDECPRPSREGGRRNVRLHLEPIAGPEDDGNKFYGSEGISNGSRASVSTSDSGTDADDESGIVLKGLPAPPLRSRKGLKDQVTASPLLTPSYIDDEDIRLALERQLQRHSNLQNSSTDEETKKVREKFARRRRAELLRRLSETMLLGSVGYIASMRHVDIILDRWGREVMIYTFVIVGTYLLYPLRLFGRHMSLPGDVRHSRIFIRIPAAFDPATLLYPVLLPVFIALSLVSRKSDVLLPNLILGISSMPRAILPVHDWSLGYSSFHWVLSILPLVLSSKSWRGSQHNGVGRFGAMPRWAEAETLVLLYPLHQALLPIIGYLTTTSLLPAELQLVSVSMINLLLLSESPQSTILQAMLWIGGVSTLVLCSQVLRWGVALARIPSWRFRHPRLRSRDKYVLLSAIDDCFHRRLNKWLMTSTQSEQRFRKKERNYCRANTVTGEPPSNITLALSRKELYSKTATGAVENAGLDSVPDVSQHPRNSQRRHTLPSYAASQPRDTLHADLNAPLRQGSTKKKPRRLASLTGAQATVLKWCFTAYIYSMVLAIIAFPIRRYVSQQALGFHEPVGWALGYLFGNIPAFRQTILSWALEDWVALPEPYTTCYETCCTTWESILYDYIQGAANIRLLLCIYCLCIIVVGLAIVLRLSESVDVDTRRKVFHSMMVVMFLPSTFIDPPFVALAFTLTLSIFLLLDLFRASQLPPLSGPLTRFLAPYVDGRDYRGPIVVSHMFLLIGCAISLWLSLAGTKMVGEAPWEGWEVASRDLSMISGVVCVGMGDAAASLIGRRYGRRRWCWSGGKSLEGSFAFAVAVVLGLILGRAWLLLGGWPGDSGDPWRLTLGKVSVAAAGASLTEAVLTGGNDNVVVPVVLWLLVHGLEI